MTNDLKNRHDQDELNRIQFEDRPSINRPEDEVAAGGNSLDIPEAVLCGPKSVEQCMALVANRLGNSEDTVIAIRATHAQTLALSNLRPPQLADDQTLVWKVRQPTRRIVKIVTGGTYHSKVANECSLTLKALGHTVDVVNDGVANLHRLLDSVPLIANGDVVVAVAGMDGSLPTVLAGLVSQPVIAIPVSDGAAESGQTALMAMLASCAAGISVVGIDNGFGAACAAHRILSTLT
jgi:NCAIR mutase (PurE)-related protein